MLRRAPTATSPPVHTRWRRMPTRSAAGSPAGISARRSGESQHPARSLRAARRMTFLVRSPNVWALGDASDIFPRKGDTGSGADRGLVRRVGGAGERRANASRPRSRHYRALINDAVAEYDAHHFEEARALFRRAHELEPSARTWRGIGMAAFELRDYVKSLRALEASLVDSRLPLTGTERDQVQALADTRARLRRALRDPSVSQGGGAARRRRADDARRRRHLAAGVRPPRPDRGRRRSPVRDARDQRRRRRAARDQHQPAADAATGDVELTDEPRADRAASSRAGVVVRGRRRARRQERSAACSGGAFRATSSMAATMRWLVVAFATIAAGWSCAIGLALATAIGSAAGAFALGTIATMKWTERSKKSGNPAAHVAVVCVPAPAKVGCEVGVSF